MRRTHPSTTFFLFLGLPFLGCASHTLRGTISRLSDELVSSLEDHTDPASITVLVAGIYPGMNGPPSIPGTWNSASSGPKARHQDLIGAFLEQEFVVMLTPQLQLVANDAEIPEMLTNGTNESSDAIALIGATAILTGRYFPTSPCYYLVLHIVDLKSHRLLASARGFLPRCALQLLLQEG